MFLPTLLTCCKQPLSWLVEHNNMGLCWKSNSPGEGWLFIQSAPPCWCTGRISWAGRCSPAPLLCLGAGDLQLTREQPTLRTLPYWHSLEDLHILQISWPQSWCPHTSCNPHNMLGTYWEGGWHGDLRSLWCCGFTNRSQAAAAKGVTAEKQNISLLHYRPRKLPSSCQSAPNGGYLLFLLASFISC